MVAEIQQVPGYADFLAEPTFVQIQDVANNTLLVYLLATSVGGLALILDDVEVACGDHPSLEYVRPYEF